MEFTPLMDEDARVDTCMATGRLRIHGSADIEAALVKAAIPILEEILAVKSARPREP